MSGKEAEAEMGKKRRLTEQETEELLRQAGERECADLKLPESLRPENIKKRILEYETAHDRDMAEVSQADASRTDASQAEVSRANASRTDASRADASQAGRRDAGKETAVTPIPAAKTEIHGNEAGGSRNNDRRWGKRLVKWAGLAAAICVLVISVQIGAMALLGGSRKAGQTESIVADNDGEGSDNGADPKQESAVGDEGAEDGAIEESTMDGASITGSVPDGIRQVTDYEELRQICLDSSEWAYDKEWYYAQNKIEDREKDEQNVVVAPEEDAAGSEGGGDFSPTNVQTEGIDEADIVKTDGTYIYRLSNQGDGIVYIYRADGGAVSLAGKIKLAGAEEAAGISRNPSDLLVWEGKLAVVSTVFQEEGGELPYKAANAPAPARDCIVIENRKSWAELAVYDVSDPAQPQLLATRTQDGAYQKARLVGSIVYLLTTKSNPQIMYSDLNELGGQNTTGDLDQWVDETIPKVDGVPLACDSIYLPESPESSDYAVLSATDLQTPGEAISEVAVMGNVSQLYMSQENLYLWQEKWDLNNVSEMAAYTTLMKYSYSEGSFRPIAVQTVGGWLLNSFSMDEYNGFLRIVTTKDTYVQGELEGSSELAILDPELNIIATLGDLGQGEDLKSVRFLGDIAYLVTFMQIDPLFSVDLSDPYQPVLIGELKLPGFSEYLHPYGDGLLLGIGQAADEESGSLQGMKLSMFDITDPGDVEEAANQTVISRGISKEVADTYSDSEAEADHHALLASPQKNLIGLSVRSSGRSKENEWIEKFEYYIFRYEDGKFTEWIVEDLESWENSYGIRGLYIGDYLYLVSGNGRISTYNWTTATHLGTQTLR